MSLINKLPPYLVFLFSLLIFNIVHADYADLEELIPDVDEAKYQMIEAYGNDDLKDQRVLDFFISKYPSAFAATISRQVGSDIVMGKEFSEIVERHSLAIDALMSVQEKESLPFFNGLCGAYRQANLLHRAPGRVFSPESFLNEIANYRARWSQFDGTCKTFEGDFQFTDMEMDAKKLSEEGCVIDGDLVHLDDIKIQYANRESLSHEEREKLNDTRCLGENAGKLNLFIYELNSKLYKDQFPENNPQALSSDYPYLHTYHIQQDGIHLRVEIESTNNCLSALHYNALNYWVNYTLPKVNHSLFPRVHVGIYDNISCKTRAHITVLPKTKGSDKLPSLNSHRGIHSLTH